MLLDYLNGRVQVLSECADWEEAIALAARPLLEQGAITPQYIEAMQRTCREYNAYIVLADAFAMPHAAPEAGVLEMGVALAVFRRPVDFLGKPVRVALVLAPRDRTAHLQLLKEVAMILGEPANIRRLSEAEDTDEVLRVFQECACK